MPEKEEHIHTWVRHKQRPGHFRCAGKTCFSIQAREILVGKESLCSLCGQTFILSREDLRRAVPRCTNCSKTKKAKTFQKALEVAQQIVLPPEIFEHVPSAVSDFEDDEDFEHEREDELE